MVTGYRRALAGIGCAVALVAASAAVAAPKVGRPAPDFRVTTFDDKALTLADYKGQVLLINIWAIWCGPCKAEMPLLDGYHRAMEKHGLRVIAITTEDSVPPAKLKPLQALLGFPLARRYRGAYAAINGAVPSNYVIDRAGVVRYAKAGAFDLDTLNDVLVPLLRESAPVVAAVGQ